MKKLQVSVETGQVQFDANEHAFSVGRPSASQGGIGAHSCRDPLGVVHT